MRPKLLTLLALSTVALVGCATAEIAPETPAKPAASSTAEIPQSNESATGGSPEEDFLAQVEMQIKGKEESLEAQLPAKKMTEKYWLERGETYCKQQEDDKLELPRLQSALENQWEGQLASAALVSLCPND